MTPPLAYGLAVGASAFAILIEWLLLPYVEGSAFLFAILVVNAVALVAGVGPAVLGTILIATGNAFLSLNPVLRLDIELFEDSLSLVLFLAVAAGVIVTAATVSARSRRLLEAKSELARAHQQMLITAGTLSGLIATPLAIRARMGVMAGLMVPAFADVALSVQLAAGAPPNLVALATADPGLQSGELETTLMNWLNADAAIHLDRWREREHPAFGPPVQPERWGPVSDGLRTQSPYSVLIAPLQAPDGRGGILVLLRSETRRYDSSDLGLLREISGSARLALQAASLYEEAQRATSARDRMLGVVSHDLRNPLSVITLTLDYLDATLQREGNATLPIALVGRIRQSARRMGLLISDLLDLTRLGTGSLRLDREDVAIQALFDDAISLMGPIVSDRGVTLAAEAPAGCVSADRERVLQVFSNLIGNALKATGKGGRITLTASVGADDTAFAVADTGQGMPPEKVAHLFDADRQLKESTGAGVGLGLSIAKGIITAHGGRIGATSTVGRGSTFTFTLPNAASPSADACPA